MPHEDVFKYIQRRITSIQRRHNFDPSEGVRQIHGRTDLHEPWFRFQELLHMAGELEIKVTIPYDPAGIRDDVLTEIGPKEAYVYFFQIENTTTWKVGRSEAPYQRLKGLQTGCDLHLWRRHEILQPTVKDAHNLESLVKDHTRKCKTRDRNLPGGEWFHAQPDVVREIVRRIKAGDTEFLLKPIKKSAPVSPFGTVT